MPQHTERTSPLATDPKKDSRPHMHLFELIERHKRFILSRARALNEHGTEGSPAGLLAGAFEPLEETPVDPFAAVDELGGDHDNRMFGRACGADAPKASRETSSTSCPQCSAWLAAKRRALRPKLAEYPNKETPASTKPGRAERKHAVASLRLNAGALRGELERSFGRHSVDGGVSKVTFTSRSAV
jgi:hypothetical protein